jgi:GLPGLI family protein
MLTKAQLLFICCFSSTGLCLSASGQTASPLAQFKSDKTVLTCVYQCQYQLDSLSAKQSMERMKLAIGQNISRFESLNSRLRDSLIAEVKVQPGQSGPAQFNASGLPSTRYYTSFRQLIYKIPAQKTTVVYDRIGATKYHYIEPSSTFEWKIGSETQVIAGYHCQLAETRYGGRTWQAWFTKEIPVSDGPYKFSGLPGLIVKIQDTRKQYSFELVGLSKPKSPVSIELPAFPAAKIEKAAFKDGKSKYERTLTDRLISEGAFPNQTPQQMEEMKQKAKARLSAQNNPLELR